MAPKKVRSERRKRVPAEAVELIGESLLFVLAWLACNQSGCCQREGRKDRPAKAFAQCKLEEAASATK